MQDTVAVSKIQDIIATQTEYARLQNEFVKHKRETDYQLLLIRVGLRELSFQDFLKLPVYQSHLK